MIGIYKIENTKTGKKYIGQSVDIEKRIAHHVWQLKKRRHIGELQKDWDKFGPSSFSFLIVEKCSKEELNEKEVAWIEREHTLAPNGYNKTSGGARADKVIFTEAHKKHISEALIGRAGPMKGRKFSEEHRKKISSALRGNKNMGCGALNHASRSVVCLTTGKRYESASEAALMNGAATKHGGTNILKVCNGERKMAYGHAWAYAESGWNKA